MSGDRPAKSVNAVVWERISQEMALHGFEATSEPGQSLQYSLEDWRRIIAAVEVARAAREPGPP